MSTSVKLDFLAAGPQRTATSWLDFVLKQHPELYLPQDVKETFFFDKFYDRGDGWYADFFANRQPEQLCGEVGPTYFDQPLALQRLYDSSPHCKIIISLRHPMERAVSLYRHQHYRGWAKGSFSEAITQNPQILEAGKYQKYISQWQKQFGKEQVLVILFDDVKDCPEILMQQIFDFLDVHPLEIDSLRQTVGQNAAPRFPLLARWSTWVIMRLRALQLNQVIELGKKLGVKDKILTGGKPDALPITAAEQSQILALYQDDIRFTEQLLGRSLPHWYEPSLGN